ncbi:hypothetical protein [Vibrio parahaemolyticus]|jgi:hypothetical protein|uniref:hypothetical protein n=1 Tax=Vibrio parahaemolyticus TaxID=670 RepID=UPI0015DE839C|nr:hypothetical protein [Vibrio parahaemolyticus]
MKKTYKVLTAFKWRGHWRDPGEQLQLLDCEAATLTRTGKIELVTTSSTSKKGS